jgi:magnesium-transporting ATPase (P-type)
MENTKFNKIIKITISVILTICYYTAIGVFYKWLRTDSTPFYETVKLFLFTIILITYNDISEGITYKKK